MPPANDPPNRPAANFASTQWSMVLRAAAEDPQGARPALTELFERYHQPLYAVARARGIQAEDAADAVQEFFCQLLDGGLLQQADQRRGRFRAFLLTAWQRFLIDQHRRANSQKRGGAATIVSLSIETLENHWQQLPNPTDDPDRLFNQQWAETLIDASTRQLRQDYLRRGRQQLADALLPWVTRVADQSQVVRLADDLRMTPTAIKVALHRLRMRFGEALRDLVAETVDDPAEIDSELDALLQAFPPTHLASNDEPHA